MTPQTIDEVLTELDQIIHRARNEWDRLGFFATLYRNVTIKVKEGIAAGLMWLIAVGDVLFALNLGAAIVIFPLRGNLAYQKIQFGENFVFSGMIASLILLLCFVVPPMVSGIWAACRARSVG